MSACGHADGGTWGRMYRERRVCVKCHRWSSWNLSDGFWLNQGISFLIISAVIRKPLGELCQYVSNTQMSMELGLAWLLLYNSVCVSFDLARLIQRALGFTGLTGAAHLLQWRHRQLRLVSAQVWWRKMEERCGEGRTCRVWLKTWWICALSCWTAFLWGWGDPPVWRMSLGSVHRLFLGFSHGGLAWNVCRAQIQQSYLGSQGNCWKLGGSLISWTWPECFYRAGTRRIATVGYLDNALLWTWLYLEVCVLTKCMNHAGM